MEEITKNEIIELFNESGLVQYVVSIITEI